MAKPRKDIEEKRTALHEAERRASCDGASSNGPLKKVAHAICGRVYHGKCACAARPDLDVCADMAMAAVAAALLLKPQIL